MCRTVFGAEQQSKRSGLKPDRRAFHADRNLLRPGLNGQNNKMYWCHSIKELYIEAEVAKHPVFPHFLTPN